MILSDTGPLLLVLRKADHELVVRKLAEDQGGAGYEAVCRYFRSANKFRDFGTFRQENLDAVAACLQRAGERASADPPDRLLATEAGAAWTGMDATLDLCLSADFFRNAVHAVELERRSLAGLKADPPNLGPTIAAARLLLRLDFTERAPAFLNRTIPPALSLADAAPDRRVPLAVALADLAERMGRLDDAVTLLHRAQTLEPKSGRQARLIRLMERAAQLDAATAELKRYLGAGFPSTPALRAVAKRLGVEA